MKIIYCGMCGALAPISVGDSQVLEAVCPRKCSWRTPVTNDPVLLSDPRSDEAAAKTEAQGYHLAVKICAEDPVSMKVSAGCVCGMDFMSLYTSPDFSKVVLTCDCGSSCSYEEGVMRATRQLAAGSSALLPPGGGGGLPAGQ